MPFFSCCCCAASLSIISAFAYVRSFPTLRCHHKSDDLSSQPRRILTFAFSMRPQEWLWVTAHFPVEKSNDSIQKAEQMLPLAGTGWEKVKVCKESSDRWSMLAQYINIIQQCLHHKGKNCCFMWYTTHIFWALTSYDSMRQDGGYRTFKFQKKSKEKKKRKHRSLFRHSHNPLLVILQCYFCAKLAWQTRL